MALITFLLLKLLRLPRAVRLSTSIPILALYCLVTGASTPVVRATIMATLFNLGLLLKREADIYNYLSIAALFILGINPQQLWDIGFQLSFASVWAIIYLYPKLKAGLRLENLKLKWPKFILEGCLVSLSAWIGTVGLVAYYFKLFSPITVLANLLIVPLATLITLCGFSLIGLSLIFPALCPFFSLSCQFFSGLLLWLNAGMLKFPGACFRLP